MGLVNLEDEPNESQKKWCFLHTLLKSTVHAVMQSTWYSLRNHTTQNKKDFKSNEVKRVIAAWDMAFDKWVKEINQPKYRDGQTYHSLVRMRNIALTIIDNDGPYLKLLYQFMRAWEDVKEDDDHLTSPSEVVN